MRTLAITQNITLDGCVEMLDDWFDPMVDNAELEAETLRHDERCDAVVLGRRTFEAFRGFWPNQTGYITDFLNDVDKYVVTSTLTDLDWRRSHVLDGEDPVAAIRELKQQPGADIVVTGSITLCHTLIEAGVVDEYRLFGYPVVQGRGRRLFPDGFTLPRMTLRDMKSFAGGITYTCHAPA
ncbi:dihydrofolate reductase family protein [Prauserella rugosa]|uniref:Dihydrofolate reductase n=1 Tax=Prauserella rugosa TaxID=43354 RepID=A0A660CK74_9PSEU|nr:dihydrofolate reductase family protein [Prauserella rugosa]KMS68162.1 dihydrofolate reductase [Streptomyces regensis]TWH21561.1 dihydrofolate reductase [Prauserella rugosa]